MTSMRKLRRRLARWQRYADRTYDNPRVSHPTGVLVLYGGHARALRAVHAERARREGFRFYPADGCCTLGAPGHDGPCVWFCSWCSGDGTCPECGGWDDMGCEECRGSLSCPYCDGGEIVEDIYPVVVTEQAFTQLGLL